MTPDNSSFFCMRLGGRAVNKLGRGTGSKYVTEYNA